MYHIKDLPKKILASFGFVFILLGVTYQPALADGIVIPDPPPLSGPVLLEDIWLTIRYHRVSVTIENQIAVTRVEQEFINEYDWEVEGTYIFPLPLGASISKSIEPPQFCGYRPGSRLSSDSGYSEPASSVS